jgi:hypothetical protein
MAMTRNLDASNVSVSAQAVDPMTVAVGIAASRVAFGALVLIAPGVGRIFAGRLLDAPGGRAAARAIAARDLALGAGVLLARRRNRPVRGWVEAGALVDALDATTAVIAGGGLPFFSRVLLALGGGVLAAAGFGVANRLDQPEQA